MNFKVSSVMISLSYTFLYIGFCKETNLRFSRDLRRVLDHVTDNNEKRFPYFHSNQSAFPFLFFNPSKRRSRLVTTDVTDTSFTDLRSEARYVDIKCCNEAS